MQNIDFQKFLTSLQGSLGTFNTSQITGLQNLITYLENDSDVVDLRWASYMLATTWWESGRTFLPIAEYGKGKGHPYGIPDSITGKVYYGRGFVQTTWKANYKTFSSVVGQDLVSNPELALEPNIAYRIMSSGMRKGMFTGVGLSRYFNDTKEDAVNARKIINGLDQAQKIAGFYEQILKALKESLV